MKKLLHKIAHILKWNYGRCEAFTTQTGILMMSFVCTVCGKKSGVHPVEDIIDRELKIGPPKPPFSGTHYQP